MNRPSEFAPGKAAPGARELGSDMHIIPGPGFRQDDLVRERLEAESPDGLPPPLQIRRETRRLFLLLLTVVAVVVLVAIYSWGGLGPTAVALVIWGIFIGLAAWPTWNAAAQRKLDERKATREIAAERAGRPLRAGEGRGVG